MSQILHNSRTEAVLTELGARLRRTRLEQNRTAEQVAETSGVGTRTLLRLESGEGANLTTLVRVLRGLGRLGALDSFLPEPTVSPLELAKRSGHVRQRASGSDD